MSAPRPPERERGHQQREKRRGDRGERDGQESSRATIDELCE
jgi:hypothetical protein